MQDAIKARCYSRRAWLTLGKAREARSTLAFLAGTSNQIYREIQQDYVRHMVRCARNSMRLAVLYRTEVL